ncbi:creatininase family protein [Arthrobacter sp. MMS18-M83]|uniref:creatininase family protein n=1 Tax=Arthrobacter sp. MMS18-M83 TaxID=2996261 RepID=UPI00227BB932|nr:creatininase family protein [Arthrobacter sp. MMS18-M83]WAH96217.1 creatininase family protein [Arthrobacter sp. MMS18-M83]
MIQYPHVQAELLSAAELEHAVGSKPIAYVPLGAYEFHGPHLPMGLDALNAHGVCRVAAARSGGIVLPPLYYGTGGGHMEYPWTIMIAEQEPIRTLLNTTLGRLQDFGVRLAVLFSGHFADEQLEMIERLEAEWNDAGNAMRVIARAVNMPLGAGLPVPDHAGVFESSLLSNFAPELVHIDRLPSIEDAPSADPGGDESGPHRHEPQHPLRGVFGADPRRLDPAQNLRLLDALVSRLVADVNEASA